MKDTYISATEIAEYCYCARAWSYRLEGAERETAPEMVRGEQQHEAAAAQVAQAQQTQTAGRTLLWLGIGLLIIVILLFLWSR